jgi:hypothetical protein
MAVVHTPESEFAKEMRKWEAHHTQYGPPGRPYTYVELPRRLYTATRQADGTRTLEGFTVHTDDELRNMQSRGYCLTQQDALDALDREHTEHGKLAAELNYEARRMSAKAATEIDSAQAAYGAKHLPSMPETPIKKRGRPKAAPATV